MALGCGKQSTSWLTFTLIRLVLLAFAEALWGILTWPFVRLKENVQLHYVPTPENEELLDRCPVIRTFACCPWSAGPHAQTLFGLVKLGPRPVPRKELVTLSDGVQIALLWFEPPNAPPDAPIIVSLHGIGGDENSVRPIMLAEECLRRGWRSVLYVRRGHGESSLLPVATVAEEKEAGRGAGAALEVTAEAAGAVRGAGTAKGIGAVPADSAAAAAGSTSACCPATLQPGHEQQHHHRHCNAGLEPDASAAHIDHPLMGAPAIGMPAITITAASADATAGATTAEGVTVASSPVPAAGSFVGGAAAAAAVTAVDLASLSVALMEGPHTGSAAATNCLPRNLNLPALGLGFPAFNLSNLHLPNLPNINLLNINLSNINLPTLNLPNISLGFPTLGLGLPALSLFTQPETPGANSAVTNTLTDTEAFDDEAYDAACAEEPSAGYEGHAGCRAAARKWQHAGGAASRAGSKSGGGSLFAGTMAAMFGPSSGGAGGSMGCGLSSCGGAATDSATMAAARTATRAASKAKAAAAAAARVACVDPEVLRRTRKAFPQHADTEDFGEVLGHVRRSWPLAPMAAVGFSMGSNVLVKFLGEQGQRREQQAAAAEAAAKAAAAGAAAAAAAEAASAAARQAVADAAAAAAAAAGEGHVAGGDEERKRSRVEAEAAVAAAAAVDASEAAAAAEAAAVAAAADAVAAGGGGGEDGGCSGCQVVQRHNPLVAAVSVCNGYDIVEGTANLVSHRPLSDRIMTAALHRLLRRKLPEVQALCAAHGLLVDFDEVLACSSIREFEQRLMLPICGLSDLDHYYQHNNCRHALQHVSTPLLCLSARDDPVIHPSLLRYAEAAAAANPALLLAVTRRGGHLGWMSGWRGGSWMMQVIMQFLGAALQQQRERDGEEKEQRAAGAQREREEGKEEKEEEDKGTKEEQREREKEGENEHPLQQQQQQQTGDAAKEQQQRRQRVQLREEAVVAGLDDVAAEDVPVHAEVTQPGPHGAGEGSPVMVEKLGEAAVAAATTTFEHVGREIGVSAREVEVVIVGSPTLDERRVKPGQVEVRAGSGGGGGGVLGGAELVGWGAGNRPSARAGAAAGALGEVVID